jgi:intein/homing endonuclease
VSLQPDYDYRLYEDISDDHFEMMQTGQKFLKANLGLGEVDVIELTRIQYRHGLPQEHYVYNLDVGNSNTFFANGILGHNAKAKQLEQ